MAATSRVGQCIGLHARNFDALFADMNCRTLAAERDDQGLDLGSDLVQRPAGALRQCLGLVVVDGDVAGLVDERTGFLAVEQRDALSWIENERNAGIGEDRKSTRLNSSH